MKNFLYKLIFPECGKLYFGKAVNENRYGKNNKPEEKFVGPHHNVEVQNLLDAGEFCYFHVVKIFETAEELCASEEKFLKKVWKTDDWATRPRWLLNRNRNSVGWASGDLHPNKKAEAKERMRKQMVGNSYGAANRGRKNHWMEGENNPVHSLSQEQMVRNAERMQTPGARQKAKETWEETKLDPNFIHGNTGNTRADLGKRNRTPERRAANKELALKKTPCPHCGKEMNAGNMARHITAKHK